MRIAVVGAGYVGLVASTCFAETGQDVTVIDVDSTKIDRLRKAEVPFFEPGLHDLLKKNIEERRLSFTTDLAEAVRDARIVFIAVGTPEGEDGSADLSHVLEAARQIGRAMTGPLIVVNKSTVPVGTARKVTEIISKISSHPVHVVSNPEFLKEGAAVDDFLRPDRVVIGTEDEGTRKVMADLYEPFLRPGHDILFMDPASAEVTKYAANGLLAARITFMNEMALLCDGVGADVDSVRRGLGSDQRIGHSFLFPGVGYGGSCFPKDVRALIRIGEQYALPMRILRAVDQVNERQKHVLSNLILSRFDGRLDGKTIAVWGLSYKPKTDDVREAPSLVIIHDLLSAGAAVRVYDPEGQDNAQQKLKERVSYHGSGYEGCKGADALVVVTEWNEFRRPDFDRIKSLLKQPILFDGRNVYEPDIMRRLGFEYFSVGRSHA
jgi:UDPglucose 6-dehydrogenase